jgi:putative transposase
MWEIESNGVGNGSEQGAARPGQCRFVGSPPLGFVGTIRRECLDRVLVVGRRHLGAVVYEYSEHYNGHRPHRSLDQQPPQRKDVAPPGLQNVDPSRLKRTNLLRGVIHEYRLVA